jgi:hypothetical protein
VESPLNFKKFINPKKFTFKNTSVMKKIVCFYFLFTILINVGFAQYPPAAGKEGSTAIHKDSSIFKNWAKHCSIKRGWKDISQKDSGFATIGDSLSAIGMAGLNGVVSLGDSGVAILQFDYPIMDKDGWDFAVFENTFDDRYLELAFVEVSSDGWRYFRFPCHSLSDTLIQTQAFGYTEPENINNLAGKYRGGYGTPFDISSLPDYKDLIKDHIKYVKIIDVVGSLNPKYANYDTAHRKINDPWPTPFNSSGFDLDAVGVIHENRSAGITPINNSYLLKGPNPIGDNQSLWIEDANKKSFSLYVFDIHGHLFSEIRIHENKQIIPSDYLPKGVFYINHSENSTFHYKGIKY